MSDIAIRKMLADVIKNVDYDTYKELFVRPEDPEFAEEKISELILVVKEHLV